MYPKLLIFDAAECASSKANRNGNVSGAYFCQNASCESGSPCVYDTATMFAVALCHVYSMDPPFLGSNRSAITFAICVGGKSIFVCFRRFLFLFVLRMQSKIKSVGIKTENQSPVCISQSMFQLFDTRFNGSMQRLSTMFRCFMVRYWVQDHWRSIGLGSLWVGLGKSKQIPGRGISHVLVDQCLNS